MEEKLKGWIQDGIAAGIKNFGEGLKESFKYMVHSWQYGIIDIGLFIVLCLLAFYCYEIIICDKAKREKAASRLYFGFIAAFILRLAAAVTMLK